MKTFLKVIGVLFAVAFVGFGVWYWQALQIAGDPLLTSCRAVDIYDDVTGEKIVGVEDMDFDFETGTIFMSAYDRRAVAREVEEGNVTTQGGIYTLNVSDITDTPSLNLTDISRALKEAGHEFRPHGFSVAKETSGSLLAAVNRRYNNNHYLTGVYHKDTPGFWETSVDVFSFSTEGLVPEDSQQAEGACDPNDVLIRAGEIFVTDSYLQCEKGNRERINTPLNIYKLPPRFEKSWISGDYLNGITVWGEKGLVISDTIGKSTLFAKVTYEDVVVNGEKGTMQTHEFNGGISLPIAPDNLTVDEDDNLYVAGFPNLIDYYFYMQGWMGVKKSPSAVYRISPERYEEKLLYKDDGSMISGATVALRAGDYLVMGSAWDDNIAICEGINGLD